MRLDNAPRSLQQPDPRSGYPYPEDRTSAPFMLTMRANEIKRADREKIECRVYVGMYPELQSFNISTRQNGVASAGLLRTSLSARELEVIPRTRSFSDVQ